MRDYIQYDPWGVHTQMRLKEYASNASHLVLQRKKCKKLRYCETCKTDQPVNGQPHIKGWKCSTCILSSHDGKS